MWYNDFWGGIPLSNSRLSNKKLARFENNVEFQNTFQQLYTTAMNVFKWEGLPDTCDERMLERAFLLSGRALFCQVEGSLLTLAGGGSSNLTIYGYPVEAWGWGYNGFSRQFRLYVPGTDISTEVRKTAGGSNAAGYEAVLGYDNANAYPYVSYLVNAAKRLTDMMRSMDVVIQNLKQPVIITCEESMVNTVKETLNQRESNVTAIISSGRLPVDSFKVWDTKPNPETLIAMREHYEWVHNNVKTILGINSNEQVDKKERLLVDEVNANNMQRVESVEKRLVYRQKCADLVNKAFGTNISVRLRNEDEWDEPYDLSKKDPDEVDEEDLY